MILVKGSRLQIVGLLTCLSCWMLWLTPGLSRGGLLSSLDRGYGPTTPGGYTVRVEPYTITMAHSQRSQLSVTVENAAGQPVDDVLVQFRPSEGTVTTGTSHTRGGGVTGVFTVASGSDSPRTAFIIVTVEDVEVTVFIDIVPAVYGR